MSHKLTLELSLGILKKQTAILNIMDTYAVIRNGVTAVKLSRAYNRLWDSLEYEGDHRYLEGVRQTSKSMEVRRLEENVANFEILPRWKLGPERTCEEDIDNEDLEAAIEYLDNAKRLMRNLPGRTPVFRFTYGS